MLNLEFILRYFVNRAPGFQALESPEKCTGPPKSWNYKPVVLELLVLV